MYLIVITLFIQYNKHSELYIKIKNDFYEAHPSGQLNLSLFYLELLNQSNKKLMQSSNTNLDEKLYFNVLIDFSEYESKMDISNVIYAEKYKLVKINLGTLNITFHGQVRIKMDKDNIYHHQSCNHY